MPTVVYKFHKIRHSINCVRRNGGRRSSSRAARSARQLRVFVIKAWSMVVVPCGVEGQVIGNMEKMRRDSAGP